MDNDPGQAKKFLKIIKQIESSGGKNFNHDLINEGIHTGDRAIGNYGLMPNTVNETLNRLRMQGNMSPDLKGLKDMDHAQLKTYLEQHPEQEEKIAEALANRVLSRQKDENKAAYSWKQGHNLTPEDISKVPYEENDYVKKYMNFKKAGIGEEDNGL